MENQQAQTHENKAAASPKDTENIDEDDDFWSRYSGYYPDNYRWEDRENPCKPSYYTTDKWASRNLMASNIGLIAKRGNDSLDRLFA